MKPLIKYDPRLKLDAITGCVPKELEKFVDSRKLWHWRREKLSGYIGFDYYNNRNRNNLFLNGEVLELNKKIEKLNAELEILRLVCKILGNNPKMIELLFANKDILVECIEKNRKLIKIRSFCKTISINPATYCSWKKKSKKVCKLTYDFVCVVRNPNQITIEEERKIIEVLKDERYAHYTLTSLMLMAAHENIVHASWNVWNRVRKELNMAVRRGKKKKKRYIQKQGLKAQYVNQYLHADVTHFKLDKDKNSYIYLVKDNYSRYIKSCVISTRISSKTRLLTFKEALKDVGTEKKTFFVTDVGSENTANKVLDFIKSKKNVDLILTKKERRFSNNMIERFHRELKGMYLYGNEISNLKDLKEKVDRAIFEHNHNKRYKHLNGQTPYEVYNNVPSKEKLVQEQKKEAILQRSAYRRNFVCCFGREWAV